MTERIKVVGYFEPEDDDLDPESEGQLNSAAWERLHDHLSQQLTDIEIGE